MRVLIQRVTRASVSVAGETVGKIGPGFLLLVGITHGDTPELVAQMAQKVANLRIFDDACGNLNRSASGTSTLTTVRTTAIASRA